MVKNKRKLCEKHLDILLTGIKYARSAPKIAAEPKALF
jgi:hypothetical protein